MFHIILPSNSDGKTWDVQSYMNKTQVGAGSTAKRWRSCRGVKTGLVPCGGHVLFGCFWICFSGFGYVFEDCFFWIQMTVRKASQMMVSSFILKFSLQPLSISKDTYFLSKHLCFRTLLSPLSSGWSRRHSNLRKDLHYTNWKNHLMVKCQDTYQGVDNGR